MESQSPPSPESPQSLLHSPSFLSILRVGISHSHTPQCLWPKDKGRVVVEPALHWLFATLYKGAAFGYPQAAAEETGYGSELEAAIKGLKGMHRRGITILPRGDYGCAWTPHGTYACDLAHFAKHLGDYADCIQVNGNALEDISILQGH
ncbi:unnamed protein product [Tuber melanosporum]|uniref:(Perigord truffle) hypothetical protein n=1 Tax=Tuber melanosporum (strain Mel28) TaxID=656061 RepID=D5GET8_TUBMM|nr:uncharacterized protein GSTUM_00001381001 [Tuber melanosporum]CAZ83031.1 unnamed protein product [Tuber melanosporum]